MLEQYINKKFIVSAFLVLSLLGCKTLFNSKANDNDKNKNSKRGYYYEDYLTKLKKQNVNNKNNVGDKHNVHTSVSGKNDFKSSYSKQTKQERLVNKTKVKKVKKKKEKSYILSMKAGTILLDEDGFIVDKTNPIFKKLKKVYNLQKNNPIVWAKIQKLESRAIKPLFKRTIINGQEYVVWAKTGVVRKKYIKKEEVKYYSSYQFKLKKGRRLKSFQTLNGPGKDYHLVKSPFKRKNQYYYITDRAKPVIGSSKANREKTLKKLKGNISSEDYAQVVKSLTSPSKTKGTGYLEIVTCNSILNKDGTKEIFYNPRFVNLKEIKKGNKLGFALYFNERKNLLEIYYSVNGDIHHATSADGENFTAGTSLDTFNTDYVERDPAISADGKILVFASSRNYKSNILGTQLFVARRDSVDTDFETPQIVPQASNSLNELFPSIISNALGTFIIYKTYERGHSGYREAMYSVQVVKNGLLPQVLFSEGGAIPHKYLTASAIDKNLTMVWSSYPKNGYDLYQMKISLEKAVIVNEDGEIQIDISVN